MNFTDETSGTAPTAPERNYGPFKPFGFIDTCLRLFGKPSPYMAACKDLEASKLVLLDAQDRLEFQQAYVHYLEIKIARLERTVVKHAQSSASSINSI